MSFRLKTIVGIALIELALLSVLLWSGLGFMASTAEAEFRQRSEATSRAYAVAARDALISSDLAVLKALTQEMLKYPGVAYARIRDSRGRTLVEAGDAKILQRQPRAAGQKIESLEDGVFDAHQTIAESGTTFGSIEIGVTATDLLARQAEARRFGIGLAALEVLLVGLFSWVLGAYLTRQLKDLSDGARQLAGGELGLQIPVRSDDELGRTAEAFNSMSRSLSRSYTELAAREQELRLRGRIIDTTAVGTVIADARLPDLPIIDVNPAFERITGFSSAEVLGRNCRFLRGPQTDAASLGRIRSALVEGREVHELLLNFRKDGSAFWNDLTISPIRDADGTLTHFVALQVDVSERVNAQREIARREAHLRQVLDTTHDGILVVDELGVVETLNAGGAAMFGVTADAAVGQDLSMLIPPTHPQVTGNFLERYVGESQALGHERELQTRHADGSDLWLAVRFAELALPEGTKFIAVVHDVTQRKEGELELRQAKQAAEEAANAKSEFLANMSHEIRTPMHGMFGSMEMLRDTSLTLEQRRHLDTAATSATLLLGVIDEILDFSRLEAGKLRIESIEFDLRRTVEDVTSMLGRRAHDKRIELACYIAPEVPAVVRGDPIRIRQILVNLVGNAVKFTEHGEVVVTVLLTQDPLAGPTLRFEVRDTGIGIDPVKRDLLFEPFMQADSSTSRRYGGSGLGLSIARRLVHLMDGQIGFDSLPGAGSTFWFTIPALVPPTGNNVARSADFAGARILVVDDNPTNRIILHRYLTAWGSQSSSAAGGEEALAKLHDAAIAGRPYDLALLDLNMPGMDGYELITRIQADPTLAELPLIMLSSSVQEPAQLQGLRIDVWLDKPVRQSDLHDAISTVLAHQRRPQPSAAAPRVPAMAFAGERILLVEDYPVTGELGVQMLRKRGLAPELATDGQMAVDAVKSGRFAAVLMDIQMPVMDGYEATAAIRAWERETGRSRLPIIALTAHALPADRARCLAADMDDFVTKPFSGDTLGAVIARWLPPPGAQTAGPGGESLEPARLHELRVAMGDVLPDLLAKVRDALGQQGVAIGAAAASDDVSACGEVVHRIKNLSGDVGAARLHVLAAGLERDLAEESAKIPLLDDLHAAIDATCAAIDRALQEERLR